jgi:hypothetical protein
MEPGIQGGQSGSTLAKIVDAGQALRLVARPQGLAKPQLQLA